MLIDQIVISNTVKCANSLLFVASHSTFLLSHFFEEELLGICQEVFAREREREKMNQTLLRFSFLQLFEMILHEKPVMWKSLDMGWNRWAVLHRRRSGGEVDLLERSLVIKVGP